MIGSVHIADLDRRRAFGVARKAPKPDSIPGLRRADVAFAAPLSEKLKKDVDFKRVGLIAFWDDDTSLDKFLNGHPLAEKLADGWRVRLEPLRLHGDWPGVPDDLPRARKVAHDGPAAVLTLGRFKLHRAPAFFRTSAKAERAVLGAPGLIWATGLAKPPFVATCSLWESDDALSAYAYDDKHAPHPQAMDVNRAEPFHHRQAFIRFRPYDSRGKLEGKNALAESWMVTP